jgi:hypothetical protein
MAQATSISLSKFTETVQAAVKAAVEKHPKFRMEQPSKLSISYLIRGIPVPEVIAANVSIRETQAFANEVASQLGAGGIGDAGAAASALEGTVFARGRHLIIGIPATPEVLLEK